MGANTPHKVPKGAEVVLELNPDKTKDCVVVKRTCSGYYEIDLDPLLRSFHSADGMKTEVLGGLSTHVCVRHMAADAFFRGYHIVIPKDGLEEFTLEEQELWLKYLEYVYGAKITIGNDIIKEIVDLKLG